jgi:predicted amidophosphoribosyltransferase
VATVSQLSAPYENHLLPVLPSGDGVCSVCHTFVVDGWTTCYQCNEATRNLPFTADAMAFAALAVKGEQLARELWVYKSETSLAAQHRPRLGLAAVLWRWLDNHESCLADAAGTDEFPIVTVVPSTSGRDDHPLERVVGKMVGATSDRYRALMQPTEGETGDRRFSSDRFEIVDSFPRGSSILMIDDTFTTGSHAQSATATLKEAGAGPVGVMSLGRHFNRRPTGDQYREAAEQYYQKARSTGWSWSQCCLCSE